MKIGEIISSLELLAHPSLQETYDNAGLITGNKNWECSGIICSLDATEDVVNEAISKNCNLVVAHHPIIFGGLKKINGNTYVERTIINAIKNDIAIYAIHTNLDNMIDGVNDRLARKIGLGNTAILAPKPNTLKKLFTFVPVSQAGEVRAALFSAGGGHIGNYSECSFNSEGTGTFKAGTGTDPYVGKQGSQHREQEMKIEVIFPAWLESTMTRQLLEAHPYEEPAFDIIALENPFRHTGAGLIGQLPVAESEQAFLGRLKKELGLRIVRHTALTGKMIQKVALCGGAGSFLVSKSLAAGADAFVTADMKYHEFFDADGRMLIADVGHYESEQFTIELLAEYLEQKFPTFAVLKTAVITNPVHYS